ncbi:MAG: hypothetical protein P8K76_04275 [Candidatus Binatia bacterium]|jgi:hypothetical protein|nr:hypothetical protein [Candidatus Binatia bacterium]MDG2008972.1 hypothetical protein [Candidatus Binatia bacterium]
MAGILIVGIGLFQSLAEIAGLRFELEMLVAGTVVFTAGRLIESRDGD